MNIDDGRIIARFQRLTTELLAEKRLGQWHPELVDEIYRASLELERRGLKKSPEYGNAMSWVDQQAWRLVELARLGSPDLPPPPDSSEATQQRKQMPPRGPNDDDDEFEDEEDEEDEDLEPPVVREPDE